MYRVPDKYYFRLHHPRPRFKDQVEDVIVFVASKIAMIGKQRADVFDRQLFDAIRSFPGNSTKRGKTIRNWETEISALFGLVLESDDNREPSPRALELAKDSDLVRFFKLFCYFFQYPGGFNKPERTVEMVKEGIDFRPASYVLNMLLLAEEKTRKRQGLRAEEAAHCIWNDKRVTCNNEEPEYCWARIQDGRQKQVEYDCRGDVVRYAKDILDYMVLANLMKKHGPLYYANRSEIAAISRCLRPEGNFDYSGCVSIELVKEAKPRWLRYFAQPKEPGFFATDIGALLDSTPVSELKPLPSVLELVAARIRLAKPIGDYGENLVLKHEVLRLKHAGRGDLADQVKVMPNSTLVGYDINSREFDGNMRCIEVKTTASASAVSFRQFHLTANEWNAAKTYRDAYHVYRLMVNTQVGIRLFIIRDPVGKYRQGMIEMTPVGGADMSFRDDSGNYERLLAD